VRKGKIASYLEEPLSDCTFLLQIPWKNAAERDRVKLNIIVGI